VGGFELRRVSGVGDPLLGATYPNTGRNPPELREYVPVPFFVSPGGRSVTDIGWPPSCCSLVARVPTSPPHLPPPHPGGSDFGAQVGPFYTIVSTLPRVPRLRSGFRVVYNRRSELVRHWHTAEVGCGPRRASLDLRRWSAFVLDSAELDRRKWFSLKPGPCCSGGTGDERVVRDLAADQPGV